MNEPLIETWEINNRINLYLLEAVAPERLPAVSASKGRTAGAQFAHLHNVRLMWLKVAAPDLWAGLTKIEKTETHDKDLLRESLQASGAAMSELLLRGLEKGKIKDFKPHPAVFLGYVVAHEAHHRGQIILTLKQNGTPLDKKTAYGIWEWGVR
jgi:uncharacterized damage-inducible protein DinB